MTNINPSDCNYPENFWIIDNNGMTILLMGVNYICHSDDLETQDDEIELVLQANQKLYAENSRPLKVHNLNMCDLMIALYGEEWEDSIGLCCLNQRRVS